MKFTIKQARQYAGLTQKEIAKRLNIGLPTYRLYEHGDRYMRMNVAEKFCKIVGISIDKIFFAN